MALDPGLMAILQARRNYSTRAPAAPGIVTDPMEPPDPVVTPPAPVAVPAPPEAKALARANRMRGYMQANGLTPITYGANNERRGNLPVGSGLPGGVDTPTGGKPVQPQAPIKTGLTPTGGKPVQPQAPIKTGLKPTGSAQAQYSGPPIPGMPLSNNASNLTLGNAPGTPKRFGGI